jgi:hypothetical protein
MVYRSLGVLFFGSGFSVAFAEFHENAGAWTFELKSNKDYPIVAMDSLIDHFMQENDLHYKVALITVHSEVQTVIFSGAKIASSTNLPVITDLQALDIALGGNGEFYKTAAQKLGIREDTLSELNKTICVSFMGILRWREEYNFLSSTTGAKRSNIGGAIWLGQEA